MFILSLEGITKKVWAVFCLLGLALSPVQAQSWRDYDRGIIFSFSGLSYLGADSYILGRPNNQPAYGAGFKMYLGDEIISLRPGLVFARMATEEDPAISDYVGGKTTSTAFGFTVDILKDLNQGRITPFIGVGIGYLSQKDEEKEGHMKDTDPDITEYSKSAFLSRGILGAEYFITRNISLSGEYQLCYIKGTETTKNKSNGETTDKKKKNLSQLDLAGNSVLNLTIYLP